MYGRPLESSFLNAKYMLYPANELDERINPFQKFVLIYSFCITCFAFENHLSGLYINSLSGFKTILWFYI